MAAPNLVNMTTLTGKTAVMAVTTTATALITNAAASGKVLKVDQLLVTNVNGTTNATVNVDIFRSSVAYDIAYLMTVPAGATLDIISNRIYLEEGDSLRLTASSNSYLDAVASYEDIS
jgi:hypothetical protein